MKRPLGLLLLAAACFAGAAQANGDPASDVLPFQNVFLSLTNPKGSDAGRKLIALTDDAEKKKFPIKVAVIAAKPDLGLIQSQWRQPQTYANFLGMELIQFARYRGTLVVAMPNGFGVFGPGASAAGKAALGKLSKPMTSDVEALGEATVPAVKAVGAANGQALSADTGSTPWVIVLAAAAGAAVVAAVAFFALRRWLLRPQPD